MTTSSTPVVVETYDVGVRQPDGKIIERPVSTRHDVGRYVTATLTRDPNVPLIRVDAAGRPADAVALGHAEKWLHREHDARLAEIGAATPDPFEYPTIVVRRVITITDPWSPASAA